MTAAAFAEFVRAADRWYKEGGVQDGQVRPYHERLQAELKAIPWNIRRVIIAILIMENLADLIHGPRTGDGAAPCNITHQIGLACATCGWSGNYDDDMEPRT